MWIKSKVFSLLYRLSSIASGLYSLTQKKWYCFPFGRRPYTNDKKTYESLFKIALSSESADVDLLEKETNFTIPSDFYKEISLILQTPIKKSPNSFIHGRILFSEFASYLHNSLDSVDKGITAIDIGTARGYSALCLAKASQLSSYNISIHTFDVLPNDVKMYWNSISDLEHGAMTRRDLLQPWEELISKYCTFYCGTTRHLLKLIDFPEINFAYVDGSHKYIDIVFELNYLANKITKPGVILCDDYDEVLFPGVVKAVNYLLSKNIHKSTSFYKVTDSRHLVAIYF